MQKKKGERGGYDAVYNHGVKDKGQRNANQADKLRFEQFDLFTEEHNVNK